MARLIASRASSSGCGTRRSVAGRGPAPRMASRSAGSRACRAGQPVAAAGVLLLGQGPGRHHADVERVDDRHREVRERLAHRVTVAQLRPPAQRVGHEAAGPQHGPAQPGVADGGLGDHVEPDHVVVQVAALHRAGGQQHHPAHPGVRHPGQQPRRVRVPGQQEHRAHVVERAVQGARLGQVALGRGHPGGQPGRGGSRVRARTGWPAAASARATSTPTLPVAPVTRITRATLR